MPPGSLLPTTYLLSLNRVLQMKALCWNGKRDVRHEEVPDPKILNPRDAIIKITSTAICGSDVHLYNSLVQPMEAGDILGHEFMGEVVELGSGVGNLHKGDRVLIPFNIACGNCFYCKRELTPGCDNSNPNGSLTEKAFGYAVGGMFGYSHAFGGYAGGQAEYARVPYADFGPLKIENDLPDEKLLFLTDIFPTGWMAAENANIQLGDTVAVWGCGPVGQFAIKSAKLLGAEQVIAIDRYPERLEMARDRSGATHTINYEEVDDVVDALKDLTGGRGPDSCIDAVGMEAHGTGPLATYENAKQTVGLQMDRPTALREMIQACRKCGTLSLPGVYIGMIDKFPVGVIFGKGLTVKCGQTHMHKYMRQLIGPVESGEIDLSYIISHRLPLKDGPGAYAMFANKEDRCTKVVLKP